MGLNNIGNAKGQNSYSRGVDVEVIPEIEDMRLERGLSNSSA